MPFKLHSATKVTREKVPAGYLYTKNKHWWFTLDGKNNKTILTSETYNDRRNAIRGIKAAMAATLSETSAFIDCTGIYGPQYRLLAPLKLKP